MSEIVFVGVVQYLSHMKNNAVFLSINYSKLNYSKSSVFFNLFIEILTLTIFYILTNNFRKYKKKIRTAFVLFNLSDFYNFTELKNL